MSTHTAQAYKHEDRFLINPGSATGAYSSVTLNVKPSFVLMDIDGPKVMALDSSMVFMCYRHAF
jgi:vacuolar protein sorting-associated protein 29